MRALFLTALIAAAGLLAGLPAAVAGDAPAQPPPADTSPERPPLGWLSDPEEPPRTLLEALVTGKIHLDDTLRVEHADTTGRRPSTALTNRLRLGYGTKPFHGFSGFVEMENLTTPDEDAYRVPATGDGDPRRTVVADPPGTELNQAFGRFQTASLGASGVALDLKIGRQRIQLDDDRFVGNVGWRQREQTYDAVSLETDLGVDGLGLFYGHLWAVRRIFGPDGPNPDSQSHLLNLAYRVAPELEVTPFAYLLDFEDEEPASSSDTYGLRLTGVLWRDPEDGGDLFADYELTYAHQRDAGANPVDYRADFWAAQLRLTRQARGTAVLGYQHLGSDDGTFGFQFPLGTNHKFQGFADTFLVTPDVGLRDLYLGGALELPRGVHGTVVVHKFWADEGGADLGEEVDLVARKALEGGWSILAKAALFEGGSGQPRTTRFWLQTTFRF